LGDSFEYFIKKIPSNIHNDTKSIISTHIAVFMPKKFVTNKKMSIEEYHFVICYSSPPIMTIGFKEYSFKKGSLICMAPGDEIMVHPPSVSSPAKYMTICVNKEFFQKIYQQTGGRGKPLFNKLEATYSYQLMEAVKALIHEMLNYEDANAIMIESLENRIAIQLLRDSKLEVPVNNKLGHKQYVQSAIKYIETYYSSNITIKDICKAIYISPPYFQKVFMKSTGKTPYQYIMECRQNNAKEMLKTTDVSIEEIARQCGFVNSGHFSTVFKMREGISPLAYRKSLFRG
jgi:AraC-like DNA-binding protein